MQAQLGCHYQHTKTDKGPYEVIAIGIGTEDLEEQVIYKQLYSAGNYPVGTIWVRPRKMFEGQVEIDGQSQNRFTLIR